jgi:hypothetical protein
MEAFNLKNAIIRLLSDNAKDRYAVVTPQKRKSDAEGVLQMPQVTVYYVSGEFDKKSSVNSPYDHDCTFRIDVSVASKAKIDIQVFQNPASAPEELAKALGDSNAASVLVDEKTESLLSVLFDIIMSPVNRNLGTEYNTNRWIDGFKKMNPENYGSIVMQTASITLSAKCYETVSGETGTPGMPGNGVDTIVDLRDESKQGAKA